MKAANLLLFSLVSILAQSSCLAQSDDFAVKSRRAKELMAEGRFVQAVPLYRELNQAVPNNPGLLLNLGMALHMAGRSEERRVGKDCRPRWPPQRARRRRRATD